MHVITGVEDPRVTLQIFLLLQLQKRLLQQSLTDRATHFSGLRQQLVFAKRFPSTLIVTGKEEDLTTLYLSSTQQPFK